MENYIKCRVCGKEFKFLTPNHLKLHNMSMQEYRQQFPDAELKAKTKKKEIPEEIPEHDVIENPDILSETDLDDLGENPDICHVEKNKILQQLKTVLPNVEKDYLIQIYNLTRDQLLFECITDFADPVEKIVIDFPHAFWHNRPIPNEVVRNSRLRQFGWKVLTVTDTDVVFEKLSE